MTPTLTNLRAEAIAEAARLARARAVIRDGDQSTLDHLEGDAIWVSMPRRSRLKRALGHRLCLVWRAAVEDASGRTVESRLVPVLVAVTDPGSLPSLRDVENRIRAQVETESDCWRAEAVRVNSAFATARVAREQAIGAAAVGGHVPRQPGLFDRRVEREQRERALTAADEQMRTEQHDQMAAMSAPVRIPARLLLVLVP